MAASDLLTEDELEVAKLADMDDDERDDLEDLAGEDDEDQEAKAEEGDDGDNGDESDDDRREHESTFAPSFTAGDPGSFDEKLKDIRTQRADLTKKWRNGEIDDDEYDSKIGELEDSKDALIEQRAAARTAATITAQTAQQAFERDKSNFLRTMERYEGVAYTKHPILANTFEQELRAAAQRAIAEKRDPSATELFEEAHAKTIEQLASLGVTVGKKGKAEPKAEPKAEKAEKEPRQVPRTLGGLPTAAPSGGIGDDLVAQVAELDGEELELFIAKLPAEKRRMLDSVG